MHRVNYPTFLDCRIIPTDIKKDIIVDLQKYYKSIDIKDNHNWTIERKKNVKNHINDAIAMFNGGNMTGELPEFIKFSDTLDEKQNVQYTWRQLLPKLSRVI